MLVTVLTAGLGRVDDVYSQYLGTPSRFRNGHGPAPVILRLHVNDVIAMSSLPSLVQWL